MTRHAPGNAHGNAHGNAPGSDADSDPSAPAPSVRLHLTDRRGLLRAGGFALCAGAVAACSSPPLPTATSTASSTASSSAAGATGAGGASGATSGAGGGIPTSRVPVGGAWFDLASSTVVTQPTAGVFKAFDTTCPHRQNPVRQLDNGQLLCPSHGSHFDLATGAVVSGPAPSGLTPKKITVTGDTFVVG